MPHDRKIKLSRHARSENAQEERLLAKISSDKGKAIRIAKSRGLIQQAGRHLKLTARGRKAASK